MKTTSVVVVDDHHLLAQAIGNLVKDFANFKVLFLANNGEELIEKFKKPVNIPDIVLMDINMPIMNGIETTAYLQEHFPQVKVLALSVEEDERTIIQALKAGCKGYLLKDVKKQELELALKQVMESGFYHTQYVTEILLESLQGNGKPTIELKERELIFLKSICTEKTYKEIALEMGVSHKTVDSYRDALFEKLKVKNRIGLVIYAIREGIFVP